MHKQWAKVWSASAKRHYYYNNETGESTWRPPGTKIQVHYNRMAQETPQQRQMDDMLPVRNFHNWLKNSLIQTYCREGFRILDLCCGKGGDIFKYKHCKVAEYHGVDFAEAAIQTARMRANSITFPVHLDVHDMHQRLPSTHPFDLVSAQFCLHYFWSTEKHAVTFLQSVAENLRPGGYFLATFTDEDVLRTTTSTLRHPGQAGNSLYSVRMKDGEGAFGRRYHFSSGSSIQNSEEYLVSMASLQGLAERCGLELVESDNFHVYAYKQFESEDCVRTLQQFKVPALKPHEWEVSRNYRMAVFCKRQSTKRPLQ